MENARNNEGQKSLETVFSIAIWQSKTLFLTLFLSTFVDSINVFVCRLSGVMMERVQQRRV